MVGQPMILIYSLILTVPTVASKRTPRPNVYVVQAGSENIEFINLFPIWNERKDVQEIVGNVSPFY